MPIHAKASPKATPSTGKMTVARVLFREQLTLDCKSQTPSSGVIKWTRFLKKRIGLKNVHSQKNARPDCEGAGSDGIRKIGLFTPLSVLAARARGGGGGAGSLPRSEPKSPVRDLCYWNRLYTPVLKWWGCWWNANLVPQPEHPRRSRDQTWTGPVWFVPVPFAGNFDEFNR